MNIWAKMMTALRGGVNEVGEAIVDNQALRILDQEVRDASEALQQSKNNLAEMMARQKVSEQRCLAVQKQIAEHEEYAIKALEKDNQTLAHEVAEKIADFENQRDQEKEVGEGYAIHVNSLRVAIKQTERNLKRLKQQIDTVKATENVQRAQAAVAERHSGSHSKIRTAMDSLERIKEKQAFKSAKMAAAKELAEESSQDTLRTKLEEAGIAASDHHADDVLKRLKKKVR